MSTDLEKRVALAMTGSGVTSKASLRMAKAAIDVVVEEAERAIYAHSAKFYDHARGPYFECAEIVRALAPKETP